MNLEYFHIGTYCPQKWLSGGQIDRNRAKFRP